MISAMLVLDTLVSSKLASNCLIGTSYIELYCFLFRSPKITNYSMWWDYLVSLEPEVSVLWIFFILDHTFQKSLDHTDNLKISMLVHWLITMWVNVCQSRHKGISISFLSILKYCCCFVDSCLSVLHFNPIECAISFMYEIVNNSKDEKIQM